MRHSQTLTILPKREAVIVFLVFAFAYFLSALIRAITATLAPTLSQEFGLSASDLGLLAGGYFLGFSVTQLPMGTWLDRHGPRKVILYFLGIAVLGSLASSISTNFPGLLAARILCGAGVSACLMAPLTGYRRWFDASTLMRATSWMMMTGSLGMVASTLPVQWLMPVTGWRALFAGLAALLLLAMALISWQIPKWNSSTRDSSIPTQTQGTYAEVWKHPYFRKMAPIGFFCYGGLVAMQTLWAAPWMIKVTGYSSVQAATGMFWINVAMLCTFWIWGIINPWLVQRGLHADQLITYGLPLSFILLAFIVGAGSSLSNFSGALWAFYCMSCTVIALALPAVSMAFAPALAGRALSAYNLVVFAGIFAVQWGIGLAIDGFQALGFPEIWAFQAAMSVFLLGTVASYIHFLTTKSHNQRI